MDLCCEGINKSIYNFGFESLIKLEEEYDQVKVNVEKYKHEPSSIEYNKFYNRLIAIFNEIESLLWG